MARRKPTDSQHEADVHRIAADQVTRQEIPPDQVTKQEIATDAVVEVDSVVNLKNNIEGSENLSVNAEKLTLPDSPHFNATVVPTIKYKRVVKDVEGPHFATPEAAGLDLASRDRVVIPPSTTAKIPLNVIMKIPTGYVGILALRSSVAARGLMLANGIGIIDADYHGPSDEICALVYNRSNDIIVIGKGQRVAQLLIVPLLWRGGKDSVALEESEENLKQESRGGFGSTGV